MSVVSLASGDPTCTTEEVHALAQANNFAIEPGSENEAGFLLFANSFSAVCKTIDELPDYEDPRTEPVEVEGGERKYYRPDEKENPLNAWMFRTELRAKDAAARRGPLAGKTVAVKDNMCVGGLPISLGASAELFSSGQHPISPIDATVVRRVLEAGGTIKGTGVCENLSLFPVSYSSHAGAVHNAWLPGYATGGSSSGCGALISISDVEDARKAGHDSRQYPLGEGVDIALGGDQGGSIRLPAAYSGYYGLKATHGLIPYTGIGSLHPLIDHVGPMARTVEDTATFLGVLAGYDGMDPRMGPESPLRSQVPDYLGELESWAKEKKGLGEWTSSAAARGLRIGVVQESFEIAPLEPSVAKATQNAIDRFKSLGADVREVSIPSHKYGGALWSVTTRPLIPHFLAAKPPDLLAHTMPHIDIVAPGQPFFDALANKNPAPLNVIMNATYMEQKYGNGLSRKAYMHVFQLRAAYDAALEDVDILLTPMTSTVGPKIPASALKTEANPNGQSKRFMDLYDPIIGNTINTCPFNLSGHPAMSMPVGWGDAKNEKGEVEGRLPVGLQIVSKRWDEVALLKAAKAWEVGGRWSDE
ncbi:amidase [Neohortaea acidophila]|uniref:Amidase n=1 Tax=Neohortaea acidophila TaxID=245834 RepID=A0A6A6PZ47_9PEZI|nr:amidase [Neohortaea acidophila]KAF2485295.1 amidase [Neohortaea acidophila]